MVLPIKVCFIDHCKTYKFKLDDFDYSKVKQLHIIENPLRVREISTATCKVHYCPVIESAENLDTLTFGNQFYYNEQFNMHQLTEIC